MCGCDLHWMCVCSHLRTKLCENYTSTIFFEWKRSCMDGFLLQDLYEISPSHAHSLLPPLPIPCLQSVCCGWISTGLTESGRLWGRMVTTAMRRNSLNGSRTGGPTTPVVPVGRTSQRRGLGLRTELLCSLDPLE